MLKSMKNLSEGKCIVVVENVLGKVEKIDGFYNSEFNLVFCCRNYHDKVLGYIQ